MANENPKFGKRCIFCRYWNGSKAAPSSRIGYWEYEGEETGTCMKHQFHKKARENCSNYEFNPYYGRFN